MKKISLNGKWKLSFRPEGDLAFNNIETEATVPGTGQLDLSRAGYLPEDLSPDIHDVTVRRVNSETYYCATVRLLNHCGNKLYNITVEDITNRHTEGIHRSHAAISIGDKNYAERLNAAGETHHITVKNVRSEAETGVSLCRFLEDSVIENIEALGDGTAVAVRPECTATLTRCRVTGLRADGGTALHTEGLTLTECTLT